MRSLKTCMNIFGMLFKMIILLVYSPRFTDDFYRKVLSYFPSPCQLRVFLSEGSESQGKRCMGLRYKQPFITFENVLNLDGVTHIFLGKSFILKPFMEDSSIICRTIVPQSLVDGDYPPHWTLVNERGDIVRPNPIVSVCVPTYEMGGHGLKYLSALWESFASQDYTHKEMIVADHSLNDVIESFCADKDIRYVRNPVGRGMVGANVNLAMNLARGDVLKPMFQDDSFRSSDSLTTVVSAFEKEKAKQWSMGAYFLHKNGSPFSRSTHPKIKAKGARLPIVQRPKQMLKGINRMGMPSIMAIRSCVKERFREDLINMVDLDYYVRLQQVYGPPLIIQKPIVNLCLWDGSVSSTQVTKDLTRKEIEWMSKNK